MTYRSHGGYPLALSLGQITDHTPLFQSGINIDVDGREDIWNGGGLYTGFPDGLVETVEVLSDDAADAVAGTGMRSITIGGLRTPLSTAIEFETLILNGTTPVATAAPWYRVFIAAGGTYGTSQTNVGTITVRHTTTTAAVFAVIDPLFGKHASSGFTVPAGSVGYLLSFSAAMVRQNNSRGWAHITIRTKEFGSGGFNAVKSFQLQTGSGINMIVTPPMVIRELTDVVVTVENATSNNVHISANLGVSIVRSPTQPTEAPLLT